MTDISARLKAIQNLLAAILAVALLNLLVNLSQCATIGGGAADRGDEPPGLELSPGELDALAARVVAPFNARDWDALWDMLDDYAKKQISEDDMVAQFRRIAPLVGTIESYAFSGAAPVPEITDATVHRISYAVQFSGGDFATGSLNLTVIARESGIGIVGVFVFGGAQ